MQALTRVNPRVFDSVAALCGSPDTTVVVFSGSDKQKLEETFGELDVWLAAENGIFMRPPEGEWSTLLEVRLARSDLMLMEGFSLRGVRAGLWSCRLPGLPSYALCGFFLWHEPCYAVKQDSHIRRHVPNVCCMPMYPVRVTARAGVQEGLDGERAAGLRLLL